MTDDPDNLRLIKHVGCQGGQARQNFIFPLEYYKPGVDTVHAQHPHVGHQNNKSDANSKQSNNNDISDNNKMIYNILDSKVYGVVQQNIHTKTESPKEKGPSTAIDKPKVVASLAAPTSNTDDTNRNNNSIKQPDIEKLMNKSAKSKQSGSTNAKGDDDAAKEKFRLTKLASQLEFPLCFWYLLLIPYVQRISPLF
ncbi:hypothetical protein CYY_004526 [Polysphondylium violaceum]|uniref:Uncharacterized protein n=1 Tax=Polysphondylium violaceum TaxID=133409 RepID=A0A8J4PV54_9MYCE|nr:hypothetical protein CYY_004526 [Polysphondylium violaceum]